MSTSRRGFLTAAAGLSALPSLSTFSRQALGAPSSGQVSKSNLTEFANVTLPSEAAGAPGFDDVQVAPGYKWHVLAKRGDTINQQGDTFGDCNDYTCYLPGSSDDHGFLWVNHEYVVPALLHGREIPPTKKTKAMVDKERSLVGGSYLEIKRDNTGRWQTLSDSKRAFRIDGTTPIPLVGAAGGRTATGTMGNCSGGVTPWGTILTCEENVDDYYNKESPYYYGWAEHYKEAGKDYGWVVEVDPKTKEARKLTGLGRFAHEGAAVTVAGDQRVVVYMGDDSRFECLYKFVSKARLTGVPSKDKDILLDGTLYVANLADGQWIELSPKNKALSGHSIASILTETRRAAKKVGGTPLNRPEGIVIHPDLRTIYVALTNNSEAGDFYGSILALSEEGAQHNSLTFSHETFAFGSPSHGFACPDNLAIGPKMTLWAGTDISGSSLGKGAYKGLPRNIFLRLGRQENGALDVRRLVVAPPEAEVTGPTFHPSGKSLFLSIQHPGENSRRNDNKLTSNWPGGGDKVPRSSVIVVEAGQKSFA